MALPLFFQDGNYHQSHEIQVDEDTARHIVQVLRMQPGEQLILTNGKGLAAIAKIEKAEKKNLLLRITEVTEYQPSVSKLHLCVAFTKNSGRNEWLLEKATELGVSSITPIISKRTEKDKIRYDRWNSILISALIQSQQYYLPMLQKAVSIREILQRFNGIQQKLIGHCIETEKRIPITDAMKKNIDTVLLIGPEGDFTEEEVKLCVSHGFVGMSIVNQRLRTETAAIAVCSYFSLINHEA